MSGHFGLDDQRSFITFYVFNRPDLAAQQLEIRSNEFQWQSPMLDFMAPETQPAWQIAFLDIEKADHRKLAELIVSEPDVGITIHGALNKKVSLSVTPTMRADIRAVLTAYDVKIGKKTWP